MPRRARMYIPGLPYHIVQRGNNRQCCFFDDEDRRIYLGLWQQMSRRYGVRVHAYCLMSNHVHLLLTPLNRDSVSNATRVVGSCYARHINERYQRTGSLWEGRHRASVVQSGRYLMTCYRYIELNPVRAGMVAEPEDYIWSSYRANVRGPWDWLQPHSHFATLGPDEAAQRRAYATLFAECLAENDLALLRQAIFYSQPIGDEVFRHQLRIRFGVKPGQLGAGRPRGKASRKASRKNRKPLSSPLSNDSPVAMPASLAR